MKRRLHTTISEEASRIIERYLPEYGRVNNVIEEALTVFDRYKRGVGEEACNLSEIMDEANLVAFNAKTIELVVSGEIERALCDNELEILIRKQYNKPISEISLSEAVEGVKTCLITTRKATKVSLKRDDTGYYLLVTSNLGQNTDLIICEALRRFFELNYSVTVTFEVFPQGYSLFIREKEPKFGVSNNTEIKATPKP
ncbi:MULTISPECIES: hypothetical protein [unclassified Archaeoglobus]|jgi:hypothetical protein|uniref:hypothetical protein n=1 Tax=unclassified Archaeoglobus TaxID=2643606 RepID=UPI0025C2B105|nr:MULTISPECIES: hypothetical protein [unclassified Archaeoglobus]